MTPTPADDRKDDGSRRPARKPFLLRLSPEVMEELRTWAAAEFRSLNGHIEYLLRQALRHRKGQDEDGEETP